MSLQQLRVSSTHNATSAYNAPLLSSGGGGIAKDLYVGGNIYVLGDINASNITVPSSPDIITSGDIVFSDGDGGYSCDDNFNYSNNTLFIKGTEDSISINTGVLQIPDGGIGTSSLFVLSKLNTTSYNSFGGGNQFRVFDWGNTPISFDNIDTQIVTVTFTRYVNSSYTIFLTPQIIADSVDHYPIVLFAKKLQDTTFDIFIKLNLPFEGVFNVGWQLIF